MKSTNASGPKRVGRSQCPPAPENRVFPNHFSFVSWWVPLSDRKGKTFVARKGARSTFEVNKHSRPHASSILERLFSASHFPPFPLLIRLLPPFRFTHRHSFDPPPHSFIRSSRCVPPSSPPRSFPSLPSPPLNRVTVDSPAPVRVSSFFATRRSHRVCRHSGWRRVAVGVRRLARFG